MSCSIRDNISFGAPHIEARMTEAYQKAAMTTDLQAQNLPKGLDTLVGERGGTTVEHGLTVICFQDENELAFAEGLSIG